MSAEGSKSGSISSCISQPSVTLTGVDYEEYIKYQIAKHSFSSIASVAHTGNLVAYLSQSPSLESWVLDSGASDHISGNPYLLSNITDSKSMPSITLANGTTTVAKAIGRAHPLPSLPLDSVLYIPKCPFNLVSVSKLTRTLNCAITFVDDSVVIQDRGTGQMIGVGRESQGLYHLSQPPASIACTVTESPTLLHNRLGHPSVLKLQKMVPGFSKLSSLNCESCQLGKHSRSSFPKRVNNRATSPFELVHSDVWGPSRVSSVLGFRYFVTFIDDYSRCTWLFLMKNRSELFSIFESFVLKLKHNFPPLFVYCVVIMLVNIFLLPLPHSCLLRGFYINLLVPIPHNKMELLNVKIGILLKLLGLYFYIVKSLSDFGQMLFSLLVS